MARRLPIYLLLDTSHSMGGAPLTAVKAGIQNLVKTLCQNPMAVETAALSIITFSTEATQILPLTDVTQVTVPDLKGKGWTYLGAGLTLTAERASQEVVKNSAENKGDWKPMVFIMSDGHATDDIKPGLELFKKIKWGMVVACAIGRKIDARGMAELHSITDNVIQLEDASSESISSYFKWVSQSIEASSVSIGTINREVADFEQLPPPPAVINIL